MAVLFHAAYLALELELGTPWLTLGQLDLRGLSQRRRRLPTYAPDPGSRQLIR